MRALVGAVALSLVVLAAACSQDDERLSRQEFLREANEVCADSDSELQEIEDTLRDAETPEDVADAIDRGIPIVEDGIDELRDLEPPEDLEDDVDRWVELNEESAAELEELRDAARDGDAERTREIAERGRETDREADELAREIGLDDCATD